MKCYEIIEILAPETQNWVIFFRGTGFHNIPRELERKPTEETP